MRGDIDWKNAFAVDIEQLRKEEFLKSAQFVFGKMIPILIFQKLHLKEFITIQNRPWKSYWMLNQLQIRRMAF